MATGNKTSEVLVPAIITADAPQPSKSKSPKKVVEYIEASHRQS